MDREAAAPPGPGVGRQTAGGRPRHRGAGERLHAPEAGRDRTDRNELDHRALVDAVAPGRLPADVPGGGANGLPGPGG
ncbi:hypothetical protein [Streptomyces sp. NPDC054874]